MEQTEQTGPAEHKELHELANVFPAMSEGEFEALCLDIKLHGLIEPILIYKGQIVDGRHRYRACQQEGIEPVYNEWERDEDELIQHVMSMNIRRRHLGESQRAMVASKMANLQRGQHASFELSTLSQEDAARIFNVSIDSIQFARNVYASADEELIDAVFSGQIAVSRANKELKRRKKAEKGQELAPSLPEVEEGGTLDPFDDGAHFVQGLGMMRYTPLYSSIEGDNTPILTNIKNESVDLVFSDPPYCATSEPWDRNFDAPGFLDQCARVVKPGGSVLIFCSHHLLGHYLMHKPKGLSFQQVLHWTKKNPRLNGKSKKQLAEGKIKDYTFSVEYVLWWTKGKDFTFNANELDLDLCGKNMKDVFKDLEETATDAFVLQLCAGKERLKDLENPLKDKHGELKTTKKGKVRYPTFHPTQKPLRLIKALLAVHSNVGDGVLEPFAGSGTTVQACMEMGRRILFCEMDKKYYSKSAERGKAGLKAFREQKASEETAASAARAAAGNPDPPDKNPTKEELDQALNELDSEYLECIKSIIPTAEVDVVGMPSVEQLEKTAAKAVAVAATFPETEQEKVKATLRILGIEQIENNDIPALILVVQQALYKPTEDQAASA